MRSRGNTLVELMIAVAIIGIVTGILHRAASSARLTGLAALQSEQALLLLEYHVERALDDRPLDPAVLARLEAGLPGAAVSAAPSGDTTTFTVQWQPGVGLRQQRSLTVLTGGAP